MTSFRGKPLTHEVAQSLFVGWFDSAGFKDGADKLPFSWRVFAGKNPAYDYFPCQYQLFYPGKAKDSLWYQPVFKVQTLPKGEEVWRDRLYRVRRGSIPGRFDFSVLDNGVTSKEKWSILDCDDSLEWCAFYYNGAAARAGLRYNGAVLVSKTGEWPNDVQANSRLVEALKRAGIEKWELSTVNNDNCEDAPLTPLRDVGTWSSLPS